MQNASILSANPGPPPTDLRAPAPGQTRMPLLSAGAMQAATTLVIIGTRARTPEPFLAPRRLHSPTWRAAAR